MAVENKERHRLEYTQRMYDYAWMVYLVSCPVRHTKRNYAASRDIQAGVYQERSDQQKKTACPMCMISGGM